MMKFTRKLNNEINFRLEIKYLIDIIQNDNVYNMTLFTFLTQKRNDFNHLNIKMRKYTRKIEIRENNNILQNIIF